MWCCMVLGTRRLRLRISMNVAHVFLAVIRLKALSLILNVAIAKQNPVQCAKNSPNIKTAKCARAAKGRGYAKKHAMSKWGAKPSIKSINGH